MALKVKKSRRPTSGLVRGSIDEQVLWVLAGTEEELELTDGAA